MKPMHNTDRQSSAPQDGPAASLRPSDLEDHEQGLMTWFSALGRHDAPSELRRAILARPPEVKTGETVGPRAWRQWLARGPAILGRARGFTVAAALVLAVGSGLWIWQGAGLLARRPALEGEAPSARGRAVLVEDPSLSLYHGMETFDRVGIEPGDLIADWSR